MINSIFSRGIRGAITVDEDREELIKDATVEVLNKMLQENDIKSKDIICTLFTLTCDLKSAYPAKFARECCSGFSKVPMMCFNEAEIEGSLRKCIRVLIEVNTSKTQDEIKHIYLKGAKNLRKDLING